MGRKQGKSSDADAGPTVQELIDASFLWVVKEEARGAVVRHLVHTYERHGRSVRCHSAVGATRPLEADELDRHRACRACLAGDLNYAQLADLDFSEFEAEHSDWPRNAWQEAIRVLYELGAWSDAGWPADHLEKMGNDLAIQLRNGDRQRMEDRWGLPTVDHPLGPAEARGGDD